MKPFNRLLRSTTAKTNWALIFIVLIAAGFLFGFIKIGNIDLTNLHLPWLSNSVLNGGAGTGGNVTRKIQWTFVDKYSGAALTSKWFDIYSTAGALLEHLQTDGTTGIKATARSYSSGDVLHVKYTGASPTMEWFNVVVPTMEANDAFSQQYNPITLEAFTAPASCTGALSASGVAVTTVYNHTSPAGVDTPIFNWEVVNTGADNTGMVESYDYLLNQAWDAYVVVKLSGTGYETITLNGFDQTFTLGTTQYGVLHLNPDQITKWKVGNTYQVGYQGDQIKSFGLDLSGYTGSACHMYVDTYGLCDPNYAQIHGGNFGNNKYSLVAQLDITLQT